MNDNDPAGYKNSANTAGAPIPDTIDPRFWPVQLQHRCWALQNLDGEVVFTDNRGPSSWMKADPNDTIDLEGAR